MDAKGEEIRNHQDVVHTPRYQSLNGAFQTWFAQLQERSFYDFQRPGGGELPGNGAHGLIRRLQPGTVGEDDDSGGQVPWMYAFI